MSDYSNVRNAWQDLEDAVNAVATMTASPTTTTLSDAVAAQADARTKRDAALAAQNAAIVDVDGQSRTLVAP